MPGNRRLVGFAAFTAVFAVLAAVVFWGAWSPSVGFVAPDDGQVFARAYGDTLQRWWNNFLTTGKILPSDIVWAGLLGGPHFCREIKYVSAIYCAAIAFAWFLRGRGLSRFASYGAGLSLAFSGYWLTLFSAGHAGWFVWMTYGVFAFGLVDRLVASARTRFALLLGACVAWASFNQPDLWLLFSVFTAAYFIFRVIRSRENVKFAALTRSVLLAGTVFALVGAPSWYSAFSTDLANRDRQIAESKGTALDGGKTDDAEARWVFTTNWSLPPRETLEFACPRLNGDTSCPLTLSINAARKGTRPYTGALGRPIDAAQGNYRQHSLYVGWTTCLLALVALVGSVAFSRSGAAEALPREGRATVLFFACAALVFWTFSLGRYCEPVYRCVYALPFGDYLRAPVKWHHLTEFCLCVLAGYGLEYLSLLASRLPRLGCRAVQVGLCLLLALGLFSLAWTARLYCAPVDYSRALAQNCASQLTVLPRRQFADPQVQAAVREGAIVSVANWLGSSEAYLVQVLQPTAPVRPAAPKPVPLTLGIVSLLAACGVVGVTLKARQ